MVLVFFALLLPVAVLAQNAPPSGYRWDFLNTPGADTSYLGISNNGLTAGTYFDPVQQRTRGFLRNSNAIFTPIDVPGAVSTTAVDINVNGTVVGSYTDLTGVSHGYQRTLNAAFTTLDGPTATSTQLLAINDNGQILGRSQIAGVKRFFLASANGTIQLYDPSVFSGDMLDLAADATVLGRTYSSLALGQGENYWLIRPGSTPTALTSCSSSRGGSATVSINDTFDAAVDCRTVGPGFFVSIERYVLYNGGAQMRLFNSFTASSFSYQIYSLIDINRSGQLLGTGELRGDGNGTRPLILTPCSAAFVALSPIHIPAAGGSGTIRIRADAGCRANVINTGSWPYLSEAGTGDTTITYRAEAAAATSRESMISVGNTSITFIQDAALPQPCTYSFEMTNTNFNAQAATTNFGVFTMPGCAYNITSTADWISFNSPRSGVGYQFFSIQIAANTGPANRSATLLVPGSQLVIQQLGATSCETLVSQAPIRLQYFADGEDLNVVANAGCGWSATTAAPWLSLSTSVRANATASLNGVGNSRVTVYSTESTLSYPREGTVNIAGKIIAVTQNGTSGTGYRFVPLPPCRVADTRPEGNKSGPFGPPTLVSGSVRAIPIAASGCGIPITAAAFSLNITAVPRGSLGFLTVWPTNQIRPVVSTLNSFNGRVVANAAIVPAGTDSSISIFPNGDTDVVIDINGYFTNDPNPDALAFYPVTPCRIADTRTTGGKAGAYGPPSFSAGGATRSFDIPNSGCGIPANAKAFSLNMTAVPPGYLGYLTTWPTGSTQPFVSTLNSWDGQVVANAAIVPAGINGAVSVFSSNETDLVIDINGYFAPAAPGGLNFYKVTPCRVADTRAGEGKTGLFGPPAIPIQTARSIPIPGSACSVPAATAYSLNLTVVPQGYLGFLTTWPTGAPQPLASTLNSWAGQVLANAALVPAGPGGAVSFYVSNTTDLIIDINGFFAP